MNSENSHPQEFVDLKIDADSYQHKIAKGHDAVFLRALCDALDVGVSILDENLDYQFISKAVFRDLGMNEGDIAVGDSLSKCHDVMLEKGLLTPELLEKNKLSAEEQRAHIDNRDEDLPTIVKLGDGSTHKFIRKALPNGYVVSMSHDVTELVEKDRILEEALALGNSGYWTYEFETKKYYLSKSLCHYFSKEDQDRIRSEGIIAVVHPEDRALFRNALKMISSTNDTFNVKCRTQSYKGNERWSQTTGQIIRGQDGKPKRIRAFVKDITRERRQAQELERAKDEAIAASHAKSEFLANMSHEIRTPMNGILGMAELLANSNVNARQRDFVNVINNSAAALLTIINDVLDFSKIEAGAFEIDPMPFDLKSAVNDVAAMLTHRAQEKGLELIVNYPANMGRKFIGDGGRLRQVITNLLGNAIKFTETGYVIIDIDVSEPREGLVFITLKVTDTGIGIEPRKLSQVFEKFTQADGSTTRVYGGTGLGLSISKAIIEMMDGRITVRSALGKGSTFTARVPLKVDTQAAHTPYDTSILKGKRALIVDDINVNRSLLREQLMNWDIESDSVADGMAALTQLKKQAMSGQPYDLILLDYLMPGMNGQELATIISGRSDISGVPIIMLSSCDQPVSSQDLQKIGINNYLVKPARERRLHETIVQTLSAGQPKTNESKDISSRGKGPHEGHAQKTQILVAEDFPLNQDVVRLMLAETAYEPEFANNGAEAVNIYKSNPHQFALILMDVSMPVMDGYEATHLIQTFEKDNDIPPKPIIALTGHAFKNDREECLKAGMYDFLTKPVKQAELLEKLEHWIKNSVLETAAA